jgi:transposase
MFILQNGPITALTWALEIGDASRFHSVKQAISYCGLCGDEKSSADKVLRTPLSKQRNKHIQRVLVEAAKLAPKQSHELALVYEKAKQKGNTNRATIAVARKMVTYMLAVHRANRPFVPAEKRSTARLNARRKNEDYTARRLPGPADGRLTADGRLSDGDEHS